MSYPATPAGDRLLGFCVKHIGAVERREPLYEVVLVRGPDLAPERFVVTARVPVSGHAALCSGVEVDVAPHFDVDARAVAIARA